MSSKKQAEALIIQYLNEIAAEVFGCIESVINKAVSFETTQQYLKI